MAGTSGDAQIGQQIPKRLGHSWPRTSGSVFGEPEGKYVQNHLSLGRSPEFPGSAWITRITGQSLPVITLDPNWFPADRRRSFVAPRPAEIKAKAEGRHGLT